MKRVGLILLLSLPWPCLARDSKESRKEAEYYAAKYSVHYNVPAEFVRAVIEQESGWQRCPVSRKGAAGLMQLMPATAARLQVRNRCDIKENVSGGVRYLAWLMNKFHGDLRLVAAAYYTGERMLERRGLKYSNPDVVSYVVDIRRRFERQKRLRSAVIQGTPGRTP